MNLQLKLFHFCMLMTFIIPVVSLSENIDESNVTQKDCKENVFYGHSLTHTSETLCKGRTSVGAQTISVAPTDQINLVTSPWLMIDYKMLNLFLRYQSTPDSTWEIAYFKSCFKGQRCIENKVEIYSIENDAMTYEVPYKFLDEYSMEAIWINKIYKKSVTSLYNLYTNINFQYYINQALPFSLKRPSNNPKPIQLSISTLHVVNIYDHYFLNAELGALIPTDNQPYLHFGSSFAYTSQNFSAHFGFSFTTQFTSLFRTDRVDFQQIIRSQKSTYYDNYYRQFGNRENFFQRDYAIHPEFSLQYTF